MSLPITNTEDIGFKLAPREVQLFEPIEGDNISADDEYRCLAMANKSGFFAACSGNDVCIGTISNLSRIISEDSDTRLNVSTVKAPEPISCLAFSQDQQKLYMTAGPTVYRVNYVSPELEKVLELPGTIKQMTPWGVEMLALTEGGTLYSIEKDKSHTSVHGSVSSFCVCPSGIIVGNKSNSNVEILSSQGKVKQTFEPPCEGSVVHVASITNNSFVVVYGEGEYEFKTFIAYVGEKVLKEAEDVCPPYGMIPRKWTYYTEVLHGWSPRNRNLLFVGSGPSTDVSIMTPNEVLVPLSETEMAQMPISEKTDEDLTLMGMAIDVCATDKVLEPCKGVDECGPLPRLWALTNEGFLLCWHVFDRQGLRDGDLSLSKAVVGEGLLDENDETITSSEVEKKKVDERSSSEVEQNKVEQKSESERLATFGSQTTQPAPGKPLSGFGSSEKPSFGTSGFGSSETPAFGTSGFGSSENPAFGSSGFGSSGFGSTDGKPAFGSSGFGSSGFGSSGFGSNQPAFGSSGFGATEQKPAFGSSTFGQNAPFGSAAQPNFGSSGFGKFGSNTSSPFSSLSQKESPFSSLGSDKSPFAAIGSQSQTGSPFGAFSNQTLKSPEKPPSEKPPAERENDEEPSLLPGKDEKESPFVNISDSKELSSPDESLDNLEESEPLPSGIDKIEDLTVAEGDEAKESESEIESRIDSGMLNSDDSVTSEKKIPTEESFNEFKSSEGEAHSVEPATTNQDDLKVDAKSEETEKDLASEDESEPQYMESKQQIDEENSKDELEEVKNKKDEETAEDQSDEVKSTKDEDDVNQKGEPKEETELNPETKDEAETKDEEKDEPEDETKSEKSRPKEELDQAKSSESEEPKQGSDQPELPEIGEKSTEAEDKFTEAEEELTEAKEKVTEDRKLVDAETQIPPSVDQSIQTLTEQTSSLGLQTDPPSSKFVQSFENDELYASEQNAPLSVPAYLTLGKVTYPPMSDDKVVAAIEKICYDTDAELEVLRMNLTQLDPYLEDHHHVFPEHTKASLSVPGQWRLGEAAKVGQMVDDKFDQIKTDLRNLTELESSSLDLKAKTVLLVKAIGELQEGAYQLRQFTEKNTRFNDRPLSFANHTLQKSLRQKNKLIESKLKMFESKMLILKANAQFGMLADKPKTLESAVSRIGIVLKDHLSNLKQLHAEVSNLEKLALTDEPSSRQLVPRREVEKVQLSDLAAARDVKREIAEAVKRKQSQRRLLA